ncbi:glycosyltransferase [Vibrio alfacsensis]|uniref:glycosyltransferase family 2 protein n=1 Tax=Vibrio alfacsensis TaxID=1074311 RepID=UPI002ADE4EE5|nr:glycosyltransferase [Vibrio alfacsensis]WQE76407.1 glycosyltransferase [Vibrio alfacsensis]
MIHERMRILDDVVYVFFCYKQSGYLEQTLTSALQQTIWPSTLLILDDCSPDDSHEKILSILKSAPKELNIEYRHNEKNVGLVSQINSLRGRFQNKLIIVQAGDDIAYPERIKETYQSWLDNGKPSLVVGSYDKISQDGQLIKPFDASDVKQKPYSLKNIISRKCPVNGCCAAFTSDVIEQFEPYHADIIHEDSINVLRAYLLNGIHYEHKSWIQYRDGGISSFSKRNFEEKRNYTVVHAERELRDLKMNFIDAQSKAATEVIKALRKRMLAVEFMASLPKTKVAIYCHAIRYLLRTGDFAITGKVLRRMK